eukprot:6037344-Prymnesium_polylepis.1
MARVLPRKKVRAQVHCGAWTTTETHQQEAGGGHHHFATSKVGRRLLTYPKGGPLWAGCRRSTCRGDKVARRAVRDATGALFKLVIGDGELCI